MHKFVTDKAFDLEKTFEYILSIQVSLDGFSFSVVCPTDKKLLAFNHSPLKISSASLISRRFEDWINSNTLFSHTFKKIRLIVFNKEFTLVPEKYFNPELKAALPELLFQNNEDSVPEENIIVGQKSRILFSLPKGLHQIIEKHFGECEIIHPIKFVASPTIQTEKEYCLKLIIESDNFYAILFHKTELILVNNFEYKHVNDLVYYLLTILKQLSISPKETGLIYSGEIEMNTMETLSKYFTETNKLKPEKVLNIDSNFQIPVSQYNFTLFI